ncbi:alpha/beta fold hydrolase [Nostoc sp.]|uniref:alpha/beta fold hydrolase n=1 Tax=Nostoc sp. TaxID=1180 RepID=UPI002FF91936
MVWGKNDRGFLVEGAYAYKRDLQNLEFHLFDTGHFALEEEGDAICANAAALRYPKPYCSISHVAAATHPCLISRDRTLAFLKQHLGSSVKVPK